MATKKMRELLQKKEAAVKEARALMAAADGEDRDLTAEEQSQYDALIEKVDGLNASIKREERLAEEERTMEATSVERIHVRTSEERVAEDIQHGFQSFGEFATAVMRASVNHQIDERLIGAAAPTTYGNESTGADGGFLVPPEYGREIWRLSLEEDAFLPLTENMPISGNSMTFPSDETTPWGTDGVRAYWEGEAAAATQTKPKLMPNTMRMNKLTALVPVSEELLSDASGLPAYINIKVAESIRWKTNDAIMNGDGVGKPLGIMNASSLVVQAKETSQTADTINASNAVKMFSRLTNPGRGTWVINPDAYPQLPLMSIGNQPVWIPQNSLVGAAGGTLQGRPVVMSDTCQTLGDQGDFNFIDFKMYRTLTKQGGIETATSMHLYFDAAAMAFRAIFRIAGQPILKNPVTPPNSAVTRSGAVTLAVRA